MKLTDEQIIEVADQHLYKGYLVFAKEIIDEFCRLNGITGDGRGEAANVVKTAPERIYIVIGEDCPPEEPFTNIDEVTWCQDNVNENDIVYVRADLVATPPHQEQAAPDAVPDGDVAVLKSWLEKLMAGDSGSVVNHISKILSAAPMAVTPDGWQDISTAPKDAVHMDGENRYAQRILASRSGEEPLRCRWWFRDDSDACNFIADGGYAVFPTHWMPLPAAPKQEPGA